MIDATGPYRLTGQRGTALIESIVIGFTVLLVVLPVLLVVLRLAEASDLAASEAQSVATWVARHGEAPSGIDDDTVVTIESGVVHVGSLVRVELIAIGGSSVGTSVSGEFSMPIGPYRSSP